MKAGIGGCRLDDWGLVSNRSKGLPLCHYYPDQL